MSRFLSDKDRNICIKNVFVIIKLLTKFWTYSHCKIKNDYWIFSIKDLNKCEIREFNREFTLIFTFKNIIRSNIEKK